jgi:hypothetical protein
MQKTYLDLLAEQDSEAREDYVNPKDLLVEQNVFDQEVNGDDHHEDELEDQEDFQKFGGSHQEASYGGPQKPSKTTHTTAVDYDKAVQVHVISIDSRFRTNRLDANFDFLYKLVTQVKNVISVRVASIEIPNTWYTFSEYVGNTSFVVTVLSNTGGSPTELPYTVTIPEGNYSLDTNLDNCLQTVLANALNVAVPGRNFTVTMSNITGLLTISSPYEFSLDFSQGIFAGRSDNWGLGYNLGFRDSDFLPPPGNNPTQRITPDGTSITASALPDVVGPNYIFLSLNPDWRIVEHSHPDHSNAAAFAKIIVDVNKNDIIYDDGSNLITKTYTLKQPTNVNSLKVTLFDEYGQLVILKGGNVSITLEITEVQDSALYESLRN